MRFGIHFGESAIKAFSKGCILLILHTLVYTIGGTIGFRTNQELYLNWFIIIIISFIIRWLVTFTTKIPSKLILV
jgi:hypothetical protein